MFAQVKVDLVVTATSSSERWSVIDAALAAGVKYFIIEKPLATTLSEGSLLISALDAAGARTIVNFSRRWDPAMRALRTRIASGEFGAIQRLVGMYGKGIVNNGSHMIDLVANVCDAKPVRVRSLGSPLPASESSWSKDGERAVDAQVVFANGVGQEFHLDLLGTDASAFTCFELKIVGRIAICEITRGGRSMFLRPIIDDPIFVNYRVPGTAAEHSTGYLEALDNMAAEAVDMALGRVDISSCDVHRAMTTAIAVEAIRQSTEDSGRWIVV